MNVISRNENLETTGSFLKIWQGRVIAQMIILLLLFFVDTVCLEKRKWNSFYSIFQFFVLLYISSANAIEQIISICMNWPDLLH